MKYNVLILTLIFLGSFSSIHAQSDLKAYQIFDKSGEVVIFEKMTESLTGYDVVFFGEQHNNPIAHWLQLELTKSLAIAKNNEIVLGAEMFEKDTQLVLNEYLTGKIKESHLIKEGKVWDNYKTDYAPLVNFAKDNGLKFYTTNVPRRYASFVSKRGVDSLESLSKAASKLMPPLPIKVPFDLPSYQEMKSMMGAHGMHGSADNFVAAQALKDATMGHSIVQALKEKENKNRLFLHFNGNFHSKNHEGTVWYVSQYNSKLKVAVISFVEQEDISKVDDANKGYNEFVIVCPSNMTKTK